MLVLSIQPSDSVICMFVCVHALSHVQLFATPWTVAHQAPSVHGIFQARILEWVAISFSDLLGPGSNSCIGRWILYHGASQKVPLI